MLLLFTSIYFVYKGFSLCSVYAVLQKSEEGIRYPGTGIIEPHEQPCSCWVLNPGPLGENINCRSISPALHTCLVRLVKGNL